MSAVERYGDLRRLDGRHVVVTGAAGGIGSEVCRRVLALGASVTAIDLPRHADAELWAELPARFLGIDLGGGLDAAEQALAEVGDVHGLVNAAAVEPLEPFPDYTDRGWDLTFAVNVRAAMHTTQALLPRFRPRTSVVNFLSLEGLTVVNSTPATSAAYAASKGALASFTRTLAVDLGRRGHRANAVAPGLIHTPATAKMADANRRWIVGQTALGRIGRPQDVANVVGFLLSDASRFVVGESIAIDGGLGSSIGPDLEER